MRWKQPLAVLALAALTVTGLTSCAQQSAKTGTTDAAGGITLTNCGEEVTYPSADKLMVNDGNIIAMVLAGATTSNGCHLSKTTPTFSRPNTARTLKGSTTSPPKHHH